MSQSPFHRGFKVVLAGFLAAAWACESPFHAPRGEDLHRQVIQSQRQALQGLREGEKNPLPTVAGDLYLERDPALLEKLESISGPQVYARLPLDPGPVLDAVPGQVVELNVADAVRRAVEHNLEVRLARLAPAISRQQLLAAQAAFDFTLFAEGTFGRVDQPRVVPSVGGIPIGTPVSVSDQGQGQVGLRQRSELGTQLTISTGLDYSNNKTSGLTLAPDPAWTSDVLLGISQPLMRNFGTDVNTAEIQLVRNIQERDVLALHARLLETVQQVEEACWRLVVARYTVAIRQKLLQMTIDTRQRIEQRQRLDASPLQLAQAQSFVELRRSDVVLAQNALRAASDELKRLMNDPRLPIADETLVMISDVPDRQEVTHNLLDSVLSGLSRRPEVRAALLQIDDASIRMRFAENQKLPLLNLNAQAQYRGLDSSGDGAYTELGESRFIDYLVGLQFEQPLGNRAAEANLQMARLNRQAALVAYRSTTQGVVSEIKAAQRELATSWRLMAINRAARLAAAENLRALNEREEKGEALTPEFLLDLKLSTQQRLADSEQQELNSVVSYHIALSRLRRATGMGLEHHQIGISWEDARD